jgi:hypothetical protein
MARKTALAASAEPQPASFAFDEQAAKIERLENLVEGLMTRVSQLETANSTHLDIIIPKLEFLERRIDTVEAANSAEPVVTTLEARPDDQIQAIEHKLHLLNNSIGAY